MQKTCHQCSASYEITEGDLAFLERVSPEIGGKKFSIPAPTLCPRCRRIRRLAIRNERHLYRRACALTGETMLSSYSPEKPYVVYSVDAWWSDKWDPLSYGRDVDFSRSFFKQFAALQQKVPRLTFLQYKTENSEYTNLVSNLQNCYMLFSSDFDRDCLYGVWIERSRSCTDNLLIDNCELCNECVFTHDSYGCTHCVYSFNCRDCAFCFDCRGCESCLLCTGLRQKKYCIANVQYSKEEYEQKIREFPLSSRRNLNVLSEHFQSMRQSAKHPATWTAGTVQNCIGDIFMNCQNCTECFEMINSKDCRHVHAGFDLKDAMDSGYAGQGELGYELCECVPMPFHSAFTMNSYTGANLYYCDQCMNDCQDCFGCVGLKRKQYCIFNKQYTKEEYEALVPKLIEHMRRAGEYGEFFPATQSFYGYNESVAQDFYPLTEAEAKSGGWKWHTDDETSKNVQASSVPDSLSAVTDTMIGSPFSCGTCSRPYKIIPQELAFYRQVNLPLPDSCFDCRHTARLQQRNPVALWERKCTQCQKALRTSYAPDRPEKILCEECYLKEVY